MSANSLESLLNRMTGRSIAHGWAAIVAFGFDQLNRLLQEQYLAFLHEGRFIPTISGEVFTDNHNESMKLDGLMFGQPKLLFKSASLNHSYVTVSMNIVAGTYTATSRPVGAPHRLLSSFSITEDLGYKVEMKIGLNEIEGVVDKRGRVIIDVASDPVMTCNLGEGGGVQKVVAAFIQSRLAALPVDQRIYELGLLDLSGNNPLSPIGFHIRTQKIPGSTNPEAGVLLLFVRAKINDENGAIPVDGSDFPLLVPDDQVNGKPKFSASVVLNHEYVELLEEVQLDVLKNMLLPGKNLFVESKNGRYNPHDLLIVGNIKQSPENVTIKPSFINLKAGKTQAFTARKSDGTTVRAEWSAHNPVSPLSVGSITRNGGVYTAPAQTRMGKEQQPIVVTAQYPMGGVQQTSSAMVLGVFKSMSISPRVCTSGVGPGATPIHLTAGTSSGGTLRWPTLTPSEGKLKVVDNNHAIYTPPAVASAPIALQEIVVTDALTNETIATTVVLIGAPQNVPIDPDYVQSVTASAPIQFYTELPPEYVQWSLIGPGEVDENGQFTPPASATSGISVVTCAFVVDDDVLASGFGIVQLSEQEQPDPTWSELQEFSIVANGPSQCFSNGFQPIHLIVKIETTPVKIDGQDVYIPVSDAHLATLELVDKLSNTPVEYVHVAQEGIEYGSGIPWATSKKRNRFKYYSTNGVAPHDSLALPTPQNNGVRYRELWLHLGAEGSRTFYAQFNSHLGTHTSTEDMSENFEVTVQGIRPPTPLEDHYKFERERVRQDPDGYDEPLPGGGFDYFSFYRKSIDYWRLSYFRPGNVPVLFSTVYVQGNVSSVQWEGQVLEELYMSYTGFTLNPANYENSDSSAPEGLTFDPYLYGLMRLRGKKLDAAFIKNKQPSPGELMVSLHRTDDVKFWYDGLASGDKRKFYRQHLDPGVIFKVIDQEGNRHSLLISFEDPSLEDSRNTLVLKRV